MPPPPETRPEALEALPVETRGIAGIPDLMHHKFCVRDGRDVWTGSMNWTEDSWTRQENVVVRVLGSERLAFAFTLAFEQLWESGVVEGTGTVAAAAGDARRRHRGPALVHAGLRRRALAPGREAPRARARADPHRVARADRRADPRHARRGRERARCGVVGVVDDTQVDDVVRQWSRNRVSAWKLPLLQAIVEKAGLSGKPSTPWSPDGVQDFMHAKVVVADDVSFVGSFNFSRSGERNAENVLEIHDPATADTLARYVERGCRSLPPRDAARGPAGHRRRAGGVAERAESRPMSTQASTTGPLGQPRGIAFAIIITIVTLGIYSLYWVFKTQDEVKEHSGIGVGGVLGLVIYIVLSPVTWFLIPSDVGKMFKADGRDRRRSPAGQASGCSSR